MPGDRPGGTAGARARRASRRLRLPPYRNGPRRHHIRRCCSSCAVPLLARRWRARRARDSSIAPMVAGTRSRTSRPLPDRTLRATRGRVRGSADRRCVGSGRISDRNYSVARGVRSRRRQSGTVRSSRLESRMSPHNHRRVLDGHAPIHVDDDVARVLHLPAAGAAHGLEHALDQHGES
jgi:hypothetical protein